MHSKKWFLFNRVYLEGVQLIPARCHHILNYVKFSTNYQYLGNKIKYKCYLKTWLKSLNKCICARINDHEKSPLHNQIEITKATPVNSYIHTAHSHKNESTPEVPSYPINDPTSPSKTSILTQLHATMTSSQF